MKLSIEDLRTEAERFIKEGQPILAVRVLIAILRRAPNDFEARLRLADALLELGAKQQAAVVYDATAELCIEAGGPLVAIVACKALEGLGQRTDQKLDKLSATYGRGSERLADVGARLNRHPSELFVGSRELRRERTVQQLVEEAESIGSQLDNVGDLPVKFPKDHVLSRLSPAALRRALKAVVVRRVAAGEVLIKEGEKGTTCFMLAAGKVRVLTRDDFGREQVVATLSAGAVVGEMSLVTGAPRCATVEVIEPADLIEIGPSALAAIGDELGEIAPSLLKLSHARRVQNLLENSSLFRLFTPSQRRELLKRFSAQHVAAGTVLFSEGEEPRGIYIVLDGDVLVTRGAGRPVTRMSPGALLGVNSTINDRPARATAVTSTRTTLLFLSRRLVRQLTSAVPEVVEAMTELAHHRVRLTSAPN